MTIDSGAAILVRDAGEQDIPAIQGLLSELHARHYDSMPGRFLPQTAGATNAEFFLSSLASADQRLLAAERSGRVIGYVRAQTRSTPDGIAHRGRTWAEIHEILVAPAARRSGAGRLLMEAIREWAKGQNASSLELSVYAFNEDALAFYRRVGMADLRIILAMRLE